MILDECIIERVFSIGGSVQSVHRRKQRGEDVLADRRSRRWGGRGLVSIMHWSILGMFSIVSTRCLSGVVRAGRQRGLVWPVAVGMVRGRDVIENGGVALGFAARGAQDVQDVDGGGHGSGRRLGRKDAGLVQGGLAKKRQELRAERGRGGYV